MEKYKKLSNEILDYLHQPELLPRYKSLGIKKSDFKTRFVICGNSGEGKTRSIIDANTILPREFKITECQYINSVKNILDALYIIKDESVQYHNSFSIAFNLVNKEIASGLENEGVKVFWI